MKIQKNNNLEALLYDDNAKISSYCICLYVYRLLEYSLCDDSRMNI